MDNSVFSKSDKDNIQSFPDELRVKIFSYLPMKDTFSACLVCKQWNKFIMKTESMWKMRCHTLPVSVQMRIMDDKAQGHSWKVQFISMFTLNYYRSVWKSINDNLSTKVNRNRSSFYFFFFVIQASISHAHFNPIVFPTRKLSKWIMDKMA